MEGCEAELGVTEVWVGGEGFVDEDLGVSAYRSMVGGRDRQVGTMLRFAITFNAIQK